MRQARSAFPRHPGHRVHRAGRQAVHAADPLGQALDASRAQDRRRHGRGRAHHPRAGGDEHQCRPARPAAASDARSQGREDGAGQGPASFARRRLRRARVRRRRGGASQGARPHRDPRPRRDLARGRARHACRGRHPHHARRHDEPRGGGGARHGAALRGRRLLRLDRSRARDAASRRHAAAERRHHHHRRLDRADHQGPRADARARAVGGLQSPDAMGRRLPPA